MNVYFFRNIYHKYEYVAELNRTGGFLLYYSY